MTRKKSLFISVIAHSLLVLTFLPFSFAPKVNSVGTISDLKVHVVPVGELRSSVHSAAEGWRRKEGSHRAQRSEHGGILQATGPRGKLTPQTAASFQKMGSQDALMILLHNLISQQQHYPNAALLLGQHGDIEVGFTLFPNGRVQEVRVLHSSKHQLLDNAALRAVQAISPVSNAHEYIHEEKSMSVWVRFESRR